MIWISLRKELAEFQHDWAILMSEPDPKCQERLAKLKRFRQKVETIVAQECTDWADMTLKARLELEQALQRDVNKP